MWQASICNSWGSAWWRLRNQECDLSRCTQFSHISVCQENKSRNRHRIKASQPSLQCQWLFKRPISAMKCCLSQINELNRKVPIHYLSSCLASLHQPNKNLSDNDNCKTRDGEKDCPPCVEHYDGRHQLHCGSRDWMLLNHSLMLLGIMCHA